MICNSDGLTNLSESYEVLCVSVISGESRVGARRGGPFFLAKKKKRQKELRKAGRVSKTKPPSPTPSAWSGSVTGHAIFLRFYRCTSIAIPATGFVDNISVRFLRTVKAIFVRKERLNSASVMKNNPEVDKP